MNLHGQKIRIPVLPKPMTGLVLMLAVVSSGLGREDMKSDLAGFRQSVKPLLQKYCVECHGPEKPKGDMRLDNIDPDVVRGGSFDQWEDVREAFNTGEMPPDDSLDGCGIQKSEASWFYEETRNRAAVDPV
jgi:hypothetical protein